MLVVEIVLDELWDDWLSYTKRKDQIDCLILPILLIVQKNSARYLHVISHPDVIKIRIYRG